MANFYDFSSDKINIFLFLLDASGSMEDDESNVRKGLRLFRECFNDFYLANSIVISVCRFNGEFYPGDFRPIKEMNADYSTGGATALNYSISESADKLSSYVREVVRRTGITPQVTFVCFSDGEPCYDKMTSKEGKAAIERMNYSQTTTAFAAFGREISSDYGKEMGFMANVDVTDRTALLDFLGKTLPNSCKEQSQSSKSLGGSFFSQTTKKGVSQGYSQRTEEVLEDNSWIDEI